MRCPAGCSAHLRLAGLHQAGIGLTTSVMDGRPCLFHNLPSPLRLFTPVPNCTAWWQRHTGVNNLPTVELATSLSQVGRPTVAPPRHPELEWVIASETRLTHFHTVLQVTNLFHDPCSRSLIGRRVTVGTGRHVSLVGSAGGFKRTWNIEANVKSNFKCLFGYLRL